MDHIFKLSSKNGLEWYITSLYSKNGNKVLQPFIVLKQFVLHVVLLLHGPNLQSLNLNQIYWHFFKKFILQWNHTLTIYALIKHVNYLSTLLLKVNGIAGDQQPDS